MEDVLEEGPGSSAMLAVQLILHQMIYLQPIFFGIPITMCQLENIHKIVDQLKVFEQEKQKFLKDKERPAAVISAAELST